MALQLRAKINHIISTARGVPDPDAPHVLEEYRFLVTTEIAQDELTRQTIEQNLTANLEVNSEIMSSLIPAGGSLPGLSTGSSSSSSSWAPPIAPPAIAPGAHTSPSPKAILEATAKADDDDDDSDESEDSKSKGNFRELFFFKCFALTSNLKQQHKQQPQQNSSRMITITAVQAS